MRYNAPFILWESVVYLGTAAEPVLPIFLLLELATRLTALMLFLFNIIAVAVLSCFVGRWIL
ncbi:DoxX family membrane protein [Candidatus Ruthia endofausta]|uniref:DoxX family membrane protein n=1 Tax=Candidatus Ruthia endofausta TaxID=2738852 RepID=UPI0030FB545E